MKPTVGVIFGGRSVEHEVSIISALQTLHAIDTSKYNAIPIYISKDGEWFVGDYLRDVGNFIDFPSVASKSTAVIPYGENNQLKLYRKAMKFFGSNLVNSVDIIFPVFHGSNGEDGAIQGVMELYNVPYVGSDIKASAIGMDKILFKYLLMSHNIPVVDFFDFDYKEYLENDESLITRLEQNIIYPVIVKPANLGSSIGISMAKNRQELKSSIEQAGLYSFRIIVEKMVLNLREINCSVLGDKSHAVASELEEPVHTKEILDFSDKYQGTNSAKGIASTDRILPAKIPNEIKLQIIEMALNTFKVIDASGVVRIDFLLDRETNQIFVNEINTIPGSLAFYLWEASGLRFLELTNKLLELALKRHRENAKLTLKFDSNILSLKGSSFKRVK